jgi:flagellar FliJ protein
LKRSQRLQQLAEIAEHREQEAGRKLVEARRQRDSSRHQLEQLQVFLEEYRRRFQNAAGAGMDARELGNFRAFLTHLETSVKQQQDTLANSDLQVARTHQCWLAAYQRVQALTKVAAGQVMLERRQDDRREQSEMDDRAGQNNGTPRYR